jgi:undecaprenyl diphosphate synthase
MPRLVGHRAGAVNLKKVVRIFKDFGVKFMTVYAFSTENWTRPESEVTGLMKLLLEYLRNAEEELGGDNVRISVIGDKTRLSNELQKEIKRVEILTANNDGINLIIALNYGGRNEIVESVNKIIDDIKKGDFRENGVQQRPYL